MSGGSYNYSFRHIDEMADSIRPRDNPLRLAFAKHLKLVAKACHDIEWVDSGDYGRGDEDKAISAVLQASGRDPEVHAKAVAFDEIAKWFKLAATEPGVSGK